VDSKDASIAIHITLNLGQRGIIAHRLREEEKSFTGELWKKKNRIGDRVLTQGSDTGGSNETPEKGAKNRMSVGTWGAYTLAAGCLSVMEEVGSL